MVVGMGRTAYEYFIQAEVFESSGLGDGSGWFETVTDWVVVEAESWRAARDLGRRKAQEENPRGVIFHNRRDGVYPFSGEHCRLLLMTPLDDQRGDEDG